jgi:type VII secretion protein EccB
LQAHNFVVGRLRSALLGADADARETPTRRFSVAAFGGTLLAGLMAAGCALFGLVFPGANTTWRQPRTVIVERETGTRYLYLDGILRPVLNTASAWLLVGSDAPVRSVSRRSLAGVPHGAPVGIPGAPDALPDPARLSALPWLVCATSAVGVSGDPYPAVTLLLDGTSPATPVPQDAAVPLSTPAGGAFLAWHGARMRVTDQAAAVALGLDQGRPVRVAPGWLNALPARPDLRAPPVSHRGDPGPAVAGQATRIGEVLQVPTTGTGYDFYLAASDGLIPLPPTVAALVLADPNSRVAYPAGPVRPVTVSADAVVSAPRSLVSPDWSGYPQHPPALFDAAAIDGGTLCVRHTFGDGHPGPQLVLTTDRRAGAFPVTRTGPDGPDPRGADRVVVEPGAGALVRAQPGPQLPGDTLYLVTDLGLKFPLATPAVAASLGYARVAPVDVPATLLALVPTGPALDPADAGYPQPSGT